ncbi:hypothetical protein XELAEV_18014379mg [Xenopus laevis]|uniref:Secreted protein n=1 Tax=Xenopus laevis TaxID=8355 RepID=A0A974DG58_XENLA|nr:hypothetical protein XELAEV_18014379mg [Xenopus laevis]
MLLLLSSVFSSVLLEVRTVHFFSNVLIIICMAQCSRRNPVGSYRRTYSPCITPQDWWAELEIRHRRHRKISTAVFYWTSKVFPPLSQSVSQVKGKGTYLAAALTKLAPNVYTGAILFSSAAPFPPAPERRAITKAHRLSQRL